MKRNGLNQGENNRRPERKTKKKFLFSAQGHRSDCCGRRPMVALPPVDVSGRRNK